MSWLEDHNPWSFQPLGSPWHFANHEAITSGWAGDRTFGIWFTLRFKTNGITLLAWNEVVRGGNGTAWFDNATVLHFKVNLHRDHVPSVPSRFMQYESHESTNPGISRDIQGYPGPVESIEISWAEEFLLRRLWDEMEILRRGIALDSWVEGKTYRKPWISIGFPMIPMKYGTFMWISLKPIHWWIDLWAALFYFLVFSVTLGSYCQIDIAWHCRVYTKKKGQFPDFSATCFDVRCMEMYGAWRLLPLFTPCDFMVFTLWWTNIAMENGYL